MTHLFGYGSLMASPEKGHHVVDQKAASLAGYRRCFNKRSPVRGCPETDAFLAFESPLPGFIVNGQVASLAVGTESANSALFGVLVSYAADSENEMLRLTDKREGYDASCDTATLGYLRKKVSVTCTPSDHVLAAWTYLSNPSGAYHVADSISLETRAKLLINATPRPGTPSSQTERALGIHYLEQIRQGLARYGVIDPTMEKMAEAVLCWNGPWQRMLSIPKKS